MTSLEILSLVFQGGLFIATIALALVGYYQVNKLREQSNADFIVRLNHEFFYESKTNQKMIEAIEQGKPILLAHQGTLEEIDLYGYVRYFEMIERFVDKGIVSFDLVDEMFGRHIARAWENHEVREYILQTRESRKNQRFFEHFEKMAKRILARKTSGLA